MGCSSSSPASASPAASAAISTKKEAHAIYNFGEKIGKGSFAQLHSAIKRQTKAEVAVKILPLHPEPTEKSDLEDRELEASINELIASKAVGTHANCVQLLESFFDGHLAYMVMEKCDSSLFSYLRGHAAVYETCLGKAFEQLLTGLSHMHSVSVVHRDLKPDNFLVRGSTAKIGDFGLSVIMPESGFVRGVVGSAPYMPPEMLATNTYDEKADVWSFGVAAYLFLCGDFPYQTSDGSVRRMMNDDGSVRVAPDCNRAWLSSKAAGFLQQLLTPKPSQRPTAKLALKSPFISNPDTENLPCIQNVLLKAKRTGAFDASNLVSATETDQILMSL